jgi:hypothetical protein
MQTIEYLDLHKTQEVILAKWSLTYNETKNPSPTLPYNKMKKLPPYTKTHKNLSIIIRYARISNNQK